MVAGKKKKKKRNSGNNLMKPLVFKGPREGTEGAVITCASGLSKGLCSLPPRDLKPTRNPRLLTRSCHHLPENLTAEQ